MHPTLSLPAGEHTPAVRACPRKSPTPHELTIGERSCDAQRTRV